MADAATSAAVETTATAPVTQAAQTATATSPTSPEATKAETESNGSKDASKTPQDAEQAALVAKEAAAAKAEKDEIAAALANLNRETRAARAAKEKHETELSRVADKVAAADRLEKARAAIKGKDYLSALSSIDPEANIDEAILTLIDQARARDAQPLSQADIERITAEKIAAERTAAEEKARADSMAALDRATDIFVQACNEEFAAGTFPLIAEFGLSREQIKEFSEAAYERDRAIPSPADTIKHFEHQLEAKLVRAGYTKAQIAAIKEGGAPGTEPASSAASPKTPTAPVPDTRGSAVDPSKTEKRETMAEYDKRIKAQLRALRGNTGAAAAR